MAWSQGLYTWTKTWLKLALVGVCGQRQNTSFVGGISVKPSGDDSKGIYLLQDITFNGPNMSIHSSAWPSNLMDVQTQMTARVVCLARSMSTQYRRIT